MKEGVWESILFLIVGISAATGGAYWFLRSYNNEVSIWMILWNLFRLIAGTLAVVLSLKSFVNRKAM